MASEEETGDPKMGGKLEENSSFNISPPSTPPSKSPSPKLSSQAAPMIKTGTREDSSPSPEASPQSVPDETASPSPIPEESMPSSPAADLDPSTTLKEGTNKRKNPFDEDPSTRARAADPTAPKRFMSSFFFFAAEQRKKTKEELGPGATVGEVSTKLAKKWERLSPQERKQYDDRAAVDRERYYAEKAEYSSSVSGNPLLEGAVAVSRLPPTKRTKKHPNAPKRPPSAFLFFSQKYRRIVKGEHPEMKNTEVSKELGKMWENVADDEKQMYKDREMRERKAYNVTIAKWKKDHAEEERQYKALLKAGSKAQKRDAKARAKAKAQEAFHNQYHDSGIIAPSLPPHPNGGMDGSHFLPRPQTGPFREGGYGPGGPNPPPPGPSSYGTLPSQPPHMMTPPGVSPPPQSPYGDYPPMDGPYRSNLPPPPPPGPHSSQPPGGGFGYGVPSVSYSAPSTSGGASYGQFPMYGGTGGYGSGNAYGGGPFPPPPPPPPDSYGPPFAISHGPYGSMSSSGNFGDPNQPPPHTGGPPPPPSGTENLMGSGNMGMPPPRMALQDIPDYGQPAPGTGVVAGGDPSAATAGTFDGYGRVPDPEMGGGGAIFMGDGGPGAPLREDGNGVGHSSFGFQVGGGGSFSYEEPPTPSNHSGGGGGGIRGVNEPSQEGYSIGFQPSYPSQQQQMMMRPGGGGSNGM